MITRLLLEIVYFFSRFILSLLPTASLSSDFTTALSQAASYLNTLNDFLPLTALFGAISALLGVELVIAIYKLVKWAYNKIPGVN